jgi:AcrR family transcriptional regulator
VSSAKRSESSNLRLTDRRVRRTRDLLHEALFSLIREKDYSRISVTDILERANIGRSTFYTHYRDKDALFAAAIGEMLDSARAADQTAAAEPTDRLVSFSLPVLEHICRHRSTAGARMDFRGRAVLHEHVRRILSEWVAEAMRRRAAGRSRPAGRIPAALLSQYIASTFVLVLDWWLNQKCVPAPAQADALFRSLVLPALERPPRMTASLGA